MPSMPEEQGLTPAQIYVGLREHMLSLTPEQVGVEAVPGVVQPYGLLMETGYPKGTVTLVAFTTGDASLYFSNGGGILGGEGHETVRAAAIPFVAAAEPFIPSMVRTTEYPLPESGKTRFYVLTSEGIFTAEDDTQKLGEGRSELSSLFHSGHRVITELRLVVQSGVVAGRPGPPQCAE
jgi:hypothetical protein